MAQLTVTVPDNQVARIVAAFEATFGSKGGLTNAQFMEARLKAYVVLIVKQVEASAAATQAAATTAASVESAIP